MNVKRVIYANGQVLDYTGGGKHQLRDYHIRLSPYYAWNHRGAGTMDVWLTHDITALGR